MESFWDRLAIRRGITRIPREWSLRTIFLCVFTLWGCGVKSPQAPHWTATLEVPIASRHLDLSYLVSHANLDGLEWSADSGAFFRIERSLDTVFVGDHLSIATQTGSSQFSIGQFAIGEGIRAGETLPLGDLYPGPAGFIAAFSAQARRSLPATSGWNSAEVQDGQIRMTVSNHLGISLDSVRITMYNAGEGVALANVNLGGPIATGDSASGVAPLRSGTILPQWDYAIAFYTPGGTILTADDKYATISADLPSGIHVTSATAVVSSLRRQYTDSISISRQHSLQQAEFRSGQIDIDWTNTTPLPVVVEWSSPDLIQNGVPRSGVATVGPNGSASSHVDLSGCQLSSGSAISSVRFETVVRSEGSGGQPVTMNEGNGVEIQTATRDIILESATGAFEPTHQTVDRLATSFDWPNGAGALGLDSGTLILSVISTLPWPAQIEGQITNQNNSAVALNGIIQPGSPEHPTLTELTVPDIGTLLRPLPSEIAFAGSITYGDGTTIGTVHGSDYVAPRLTFASPAGIYVDSVRLRPDIMWADLSNGDDVERRGRLGEAQIDVVVANHLPLGATMTLRIAADSASVATNPSLVIGPSVVTPATTDNAGRTTGESTSTLHYSIDSSRIALFEGDGVWIAGELTLIGPGNGVASRLRPNDYINWSASIRLDVRSEAHATSGGGQ